MLSRDQFFLSFKRETKTVPTCCGDVAIQNLTEAEFAAYNKGQFTSKGEINEQWQETRRARLVAATVVDPETGKRLFGQPGDVARLMAADSALITEVFLAAMEHCGLQRSEADAETLEKNSEPAPGIASPTA
jgi:hypothetical protein